MKTVRIGMAGPFVDAFIYRTQLYAVTLSGELWIYEVGDIEAELARKLGDFGDAVAYLMFHTRGLGATPRQRQARRLVQSGLDAEQDEAAWLRGDDVPYRSVELGVKGHSILDILMYSDRLYLAMDSGLWSVDSPISSDTPDLDLRLPYACLSAKVSRGAVAASCGDNGLRILFDRYQWLDRRPSERVAVPVSMRASYARFGLVNYTSRVDFSVLDGATSDELSDQGWEVFVGFSRTRFDDEDLLRRVRELVESAEDEIEYTFNLGSTFLAFLAGKVVRASMRREGDANRRVLSPRILSRYEGHVVDAQALGDSVVVATQDSVLLLHYGDEPSEIYSGAVASVRGFPRSHRYQALGALTAREGLILFAASPGA